MFGIDLRKWADGKGWKLPKDGEEMPSTLELVPSVLKALLEALETGYKSVEDVGGEFVSVRQSEKRRELITDQYDCFLLLQSDEGHGFTR